jgi:hypothetical protein
MSSFSWPCRRRSNTANIDVVNSTGMDEDFQIRGTLEVAVAKNHSRMLSKRKENLFVKRLTEKRAKISKDSTAFSRSS